MDDLVPPSELFGRSEAEQATVTVDGVLAFYRELLAEETPALT